VNSCCSFYRSSIGKKWVVAVTGLIMVGFVLAHMLGNLQVFLGPEKLNTYGAFLQGLGELIWIARIGLLVAVVLHILATIQLTLANRAARPEPYCYKANVQAKLSTRTMAWSGSYILCFIIFHILHYTTHTVVPAYAGFHDVTPLGLERHDVFRMVIVGFSNIWVSAFYIVGMLLLCSHLSHGIGSLAQTFGIRTKKTACLFSCGGRLLATIIAVGYISIPVAVLAGYGRDYVRNAERAPAELVPTTTKQEAAK
jgi:succinate dehydrogenase / fumarate reductase cytochrome b subunit